MTPIMARNARPPTTLPAITAGLVVESLEGAAVGMLVCEATGDELDPGVAVVGRTDTRGVAVMAAVVVTMDTPLEVGGSTWKNMDSVVSQPTQDNGVASSVLPVNMRSVKQPYSGPL
jgi:hypothetical protein